MMNERLLDVGQLGVEIRIKVKRFGDVVEHRVLQRIKDDLPTQFRADGGALFLRERVSRYFLTISEQPGSFLGQLQLPLAWDIWDASLNEIAYPSGYFETLLYSKRSAMKNATAVQAKNAAGWERPSPAGGGCDGFAFPGQAYPPLEACQIPFAPRFG